eukprot:1147709-Pleurochrysis_carterae.AAC.2
MIVDDEGYTEAYATVIDGDAEIDPYSTVHIIGGDIDGEAASEAEDDAADQNDPDYIDNALQQASQQPAAQPQKGRTQKRKSSDQSSSGEAAGARRASRVPRVTGMPAARAPQREMATKPIAEMTVRRQRSAARQVKQRYCHIVAFPPCEVVLGLGCTHSTLGAP